jgi:hypothetical protein
MEIVVAGSSELIGSEAVEYFAGCGHGVHGIDNNMRFKSPRSAAALSRGALHFHEYQQGLRRRPPDLPAARTARPAMRGSCERMVHATRGEVCLRGGRVSPFSC